MNLDGPVPTGGHWSHRLRRWAFREWIEAHAVRPEEIEYPEEFAQSFAGRMLELHRALADLIVAAVP